MLILTAMVLCFGHGWWVVDKVDGHRLWKEEWISAYHGGQQGRLTYQPQPHQSAWGSFLAWG